MYNITKQQENNITSRQLGAGTGGNIRSLADIIQQVKDKAYGQKFQVTITGNKNGY